ncbi:MAG: LAGLIDADG family homing endonuclease [Candidatus Andersenbacteria bacterium]
MITKAYILGVLHDATETKKTYRISQKSKAFVEMVASGIRSLGGSAWTYKEGKDRSVYVVEFSKSFLGGTVISSSQDKRDYIRGYFDAEGGIAKSKSVRYYLYFAQKNRMDLLEVRSYLEEFGIECGKTHNPSSRIDPNYWRFYIRAKSYPDFAKIIGSDHPEKSRYIRLKI